MHSRVMMVFAITSSPGSTVSWEMEFNSRRLLLLLSKLDPICMHTFNMLVIRSCDCVCLPETLSPILGRKVPALAEHDKLLMASISHSEWINSRGKVKILTSHYATKKTY